MKRYRLLFAWLAVPFLLQGCSTLETASGDRSITYNRGYNTMVKTVEQAIRGSALEINFAQQSDGGDKYTIIFNALAYVNDQSVQKDEGEVIVENVEENKTRIVINNPEYHFSVPEHQRTEYDRVLKNRIDDILDG